MKKYITIFILLANFIHAQAQQDLYQISPLPGSAKNVAAISGESTSSNSSFLHDGIDMYAPDLYPVQCIRGGVVIDIWKKDEDSGWAVYIQSLVNNEVDVYLHVDTANVRLAINDTIPINNTLGWVSPNNKHLHFSRLDSIAPLR